MTTHIALLRGINVGGHKPVAMADLRAWLARVGFADVRSLLQSGNLVFRGGTRRGDALERFLETEARRWLGLETAFLVRTAAEWRALVAGNPFAAHARRDPGHLLLMPLKRSPTTAQVRALRAAIRGREVMQARGRHLYLVYPDGVGRSRLTHALIERTLGTQGTGRNWNTVLKLAALATG